MLSYFQTSCLGRITYAPTSTTPRYSAMSAREYCWICNKGNSRPVRTPVSGASVVRGLRCAHPRLSPFGLRLWGHAFQATLRRGEASLSQMAQNGEEQQAPEVLDHA